MFLFPTNKNVLTKAVSIVKLQMDHLLQSFFIFTVTHFPPPPRIPIIPILLVDSCAAHSHHPSSLSSLPLDQTVPKRKLCRNRQEEMKLLHPNAHEEDFTFMFK